MVDALRQGPEESLRMDHYRSVKANDASNDLNTRVHSETNG